MKKLFFLILLTAATVFAVGPKVPSILTFAPNPPNEQVMGYWVYWSTGTIPLDTQRLAISTNAFSGFDLTVLHLSQGDYNVWMTATNASGGESVVSDVLIWHYHNPGKPTAVAVKAP